MSFNQDLQINNLASSIAINTIDNLNFSQTWNWSTAATQNPLSLNATALTSGNLLTLNAGNTANAIASPSAINLNITSGTTGNLNLDTGTTGSINIGTNANSKTLTIGNSTGTTAINYNSGTGVQTSTSNVVTGSAFDFVANSLTSGLGINLNSSSLSSGVLLSVGSTSTITTGNLARFTSASTASVANGLVRFNFTGNHTGNGVQIDDITTAGAVQTINATGVYTGTGLFNLNANSATTGTLASISGTSLTTGNALSISAGAGNSISSPAAIPLRIITGTTGILTLDSGTTGAVNLGTNANAKTITIGNVTGATAVNFNTGTAGSTFTTTNGAFNLNTGTGAINFGTDAVAHTVTLGNITGATAVNTNAGTGGITQVVTGTGVFDAASGANTGIVTLAGGTGARTVNIGTSTGAQAINIGTGAVANTITIGNSTGATAVTINNGTGALNLGTNAIAHTVSIGNATGATALNFTSGTGLQTFTSSAATTNAFNFTANSLTTGSGITLAANVLTTGSALDVTTTNSALNSTNGFFRLFNNSAPVTGTGLFARIQPNNTAGSGLTVLNNGNIGIGNTTSNYKLHVTNAANTDVTAIEGPAGFNNAFISFRVAGAGVGQITYNGVNTLYGATSDQRLKENIEPTSYGLNTLLNLNVVDYSFKRDSTHQRETGFLAQALYTLYPTAVDKGTDEIDSNGNLVKPWSVDYGRITPLLVKSIQDQQVLLGNYATNTDTLGLTLATSSSPASTVQDSITTKLAQSIAVLTDFVAVKISAVVGYFDKIFAKEVTTDKLCIGETCITEDQLKQLLSNQNNLIPVTTPIEKI